jgi:TPR repeat protein
VQRDLREALQWYTAAVRQGDIAAREQACVLAERLAREQES